MLTEKQCQERYGLSKEEWDALTPSQKSGRRGDLWKKSRLFCECGALATIVVGQNKICARCAKLEHEPYQETCGFGRAIEPISYLLNKSQNHAT